MALIQLISEEQASDEVRQIYNDIKSRYQINFVPNLMKSWAHNPSALRANWERMKHHEDVLGLETAHAIGMSIASQSPCTYCMHFHNMVLKQLGWTDEKIENLISWVAQNAGGNVYANGLQLEIDPQTIEMMRPAA